MLSVRRECLRRLLEPSDMSAQACVEKLLVENPRLGAFTEVFVDKAPTSRPSVRGQPLAGWCFATKDMFACKGRTNDYGLSKPLNEAKFCASSESALTSMLLRLGAVNLGFTAMTQLALFNAAPIPHPTLKGRTPGGSSTGSAIAVSQQLCHFALGSQTGGSIIRPAAYNGVVGFKPSHNLLPTAGMLTISPSLDTAGLFAQSLDDLCTVFHAMVDAPCNGASNDSNLRALRVGFLSDETNPYSDSTVECMQNLIFQVKTLLSGQNASVQLFDLSFPKSFNHDQILCLAKYETAQNLEGVLSDKSFADSLDPKLLRLATRDFKKISTREYTAARQTQLESTQEFNRLFDKVDVIVALSAKDVPPMLEDCLASDFPSGDPWINCALTAFGVPAVHLPVGFDQPTGASLGFQLVGPRMGDLALLSNAARLVRVLDQALHSLP